MTRAAWAFALCLLPALSACGHKKKPPPPPPMVAIAHPFQQQVVDWDDYVGRFESIDEVDLRPRVSGYLTQILFRDGDHVRQGELLFTIDARPYRAALDQAIAATHRAEATLSNAQIELRRAAALLAAKATSEEQYEARVLAVQQAQADLESARANQRNAALNLGFTRITAPLTGRISDRRVAVGNLVTADTTVLTTIVNFDPIRFGFESSETLYLKNVRDRGLSGPRVAHHRGEPVEIRLEDQNAYPIHGRLEFIDNQIDPQSGVIRGRAVVPNASGVLTPGLFAHMRMAGSKPYTGLLVPDETVTSDQNRQVVLLVGRDGKVKEQAVEPGPLVNGLRVIKTGLKPGDWVIVQGEVNAKPGAKVRVKQVQLRTRQPDRPPPAEPPPAASGSAPDLQL